MVTILGPAGLPGSIWLICLLGKKTDHERCGCFTILSIINVSRLDECTEKDVMVLAIVPAESLLVFNIAQNLVEPSLHLISYDLRG